MRFESENGWSEFADHFPIFVTTMAGAQDLKQLSTLLDQSTAEFFRSGKKIAYIVDATHLVGFTSQHRKLQTDWIQKNEADIERYTSGVCFVLPSPLLRGVATALFWVVKPVYRHHFVQTRADAVVWAAQQLREDGVVVPQLCIDGATRAPYEEAGEVRAEAQ